MKKMMILTVLALIAFGGCTAKEFEDGANGMVNDITSAFEEGKDKSAD